jgi:hypothetical protein
MIYLFLTCVCIRGDFLATYCMHIILKRERREKILYIRGINFKLMHTSGPNSNNECTPPVWYKEKP